MVVATLMIPYESLGRQLDNITKDPEEGLKENDNKDDLE